MTRRQYLFSALPEVVAKNAIANFLFQEESVVRINPNYLDEPIQQAERVNILAMGFSWGTSPEGGNYWAVIDDEYFVGCKTKPIMESINVDDL